MTQEEILDELLAISQSVTRLYAKISDDLEDTDPRKYLQFVKCEKSSADELQKRSVNE